MLLSAPHDAIGSATQAKTMGIAFVAACAAWVGPVPQTKMGIALRCHEFARHVPVFVEVTGRAARVDLEITAFHDSMGRKLRDKRRSILLHHVPAARQQRADSIGASGLLSAKRKRGKRSACGDQELPASDLAHAPYRSARARCALARGAVNA